MARWLLQGLLLMGLVLAFTGPGQPPSITLTAIAAGPDETDLLAELPSPAAWIPEPPSLVSVKLRGTPGVSRLASVTADFGIELLRSNEWTGAHTLRVPAGADPQAYADLLALDPRVEWAEAVQWRRLTVGNAAPLTPNDQFYTNNQKWYYDVIKAPDAWGVTTGSPSVVIAVIDSGVMCTHSDLAVNMWVNAKEVPGNGIDDDSNGFVDDVHGYDFVGAEIGTFAAPNHPGDGNPCVSAGDSSDGNGLDDEGNGSADDGVTHGTFVAGIAAAAGNNGAGVAGACWTCKIMSVRVANPEGWLRSSDTADAISYAARNGAKVINLSLGGNQASQAEISAIDLAVSSGVIVIAASGNENKTPISYPARLSNVIAVGASSHENTKGRAAFSNWGQGTPSNPSVAVVAPGVDNASTAIRSVADQNAGAGTAGTQGYLRGSGTSFSTPLVSGIVGLMLSVNPALTPAQIRSMLTSTAEPLPDDSADTPNAGTTWAGAGMVNAFGAVSAAGGGAPTPTPVPGTPSPTPVPGTPTPTPTPLPSGSIPQPVAPPPGTLLSDLGTTVHWNLATGTTQYQIQVIPANNDGPAINLIRDVDRSYVVVPPVFGAGPYVMLPGMTYTWRIRTTTATTSIDENSGLWGAWSAASSFRTRSSGSSTVTAVAPSQGVTVAGLTPTLQWSNTDPGVFYYEVQLSKDDTFNTNPATATAMVYWVLLHGALTAPVNAYAVPASFPLEGRTQYSWRVRPRIQGDGTPAAWSSTFRFATP